MLSIIRSVEEHCLTGLGDFEMTEEPFIEMELLSSDRSLVTTETIVGRFSIVISKQSLAQSELFT